MTRHFPSTHQRSPNHSSNNNNNTLHQQQQHPFSHRPQQQQQQQQPTLASELIREQTEQTSVQITTTGPSHDLSLADSPSWSSAMTTSHPPIDHFYPYQEAAVGHAHAPTPHPDSSRPLPLSRSSIAARQRSLSHSAAAQVQAQQQQVQQVEAALHYSQGLHRQQQAQLMSLRLEEEEEARRNSEEDYIQRLVAAYQQQQQHHPHHQGHPLPPHPHPHQQQRPQQQQHLPYYHLSEDLPHFPTHRPIAHEHPTAHDPHSALLEGYSSSSSSSNNNNNNSSSNSSHNPHSQMQRYRGEEEGTANTIKFESPSLRTPPLLLE
jgi:hypothetical protein